MTFALSLVFVHCRFLQILFMSRHSGHIRRPKQARRQHGDKNVTNFYSKNSSFACLALAIIPFFFVFLPLSSFTRREMTRLAVKRTT